MTLNETLWDGVNSAGWWFWFPLVGYGIYGLFKIYRLPVAGTLQIRISRVLKSSACICMIFIPLFNGLGPYAFHLLGISMCILLQQAYDKGVVKAKRKPVEAASIIGRMAERVTDKALT